MPLRINGGSSDSCVVERRGAAKYNNNNVIIATAIEAAAAVDILFNSIRADVDATAVPSTVNSACGVDLRR